MDLKEVQRAGTMVEKAAEKEVTEGRERMAGYLAVVEGMVAKEDRAGTAAEVHSVGRAGVEMSTDVEAGQEATQDAGSLTQMTVQVL